MDISLPPDLEEYVEIQVHNGFYRSASEMIGEGLRLLIAKETEQGKLQELKREIQIGTDQAERGQVSEFTAETLERLKSEGRDRLATERSPKIS
ncbi:MAG: type II toxin-antitoxin system ParD family antitoxin [Isosphaeraceae bacterium]